MGLVGEVLMKRHTQYDGAADIDGHAASTCTIMLVGAYPFDDTRDPRT
jgi:hypothetical protein